LLKVLFRLNTLGTWKRFQPLSTHCYHPLFHSGRSLLSFVNVDSLTRFKWPTGFLLPKDETKMPVGKTKDGRERKNAAGQLDSCDAEWN